MKTAKSLYPINHADAEKTKTSLIHLLNCLNLEASILERKVRASNSIAIDELTQTLITLCEKLEAWNRQLEALPSEREKPFKTCCCDKQAYINSYFEAGTE